MWLHPDLAYGPQAMSAEIGPNSALYFEVELLEVMPDIAVEEPAEVTEEVVEE